MNTLPTLRSVASATVALAVGSTPEQLASFLRAEVTKNTELIRSAGIKAE